MSRRIPPVGRLLLAAVGFVLAVLLLGQLPSNWRLDLTQNRLYTLSPGTLSIIQGIDEPVELTLYVSESAVADHPALRSYAQRVRELVVEVASRGGDRIRLEVVDPRPFSEAEDDAIEQGLEPMPVGPGGQRMFLGLVGRGAQGEEVAIPFFQPDKEPFLEYDLAKLLQALSESYRPVVGLMAGLPTGPAFDPQTGQMDPGWVIDGELRQLFDIRRISRQTDALDPDLDLLLVIHPRDLSEEAEYAIDQFVLAGGRVVVFVDPLAESDVATLAARLQGEGDSSSSLPRLFQAWGVAFSRGEAVLDAFSALQVQTAEGAAARHPGLLGLGPETMSQQDIVTAGLEAVNLSSAGHFEATGTDGLQLEPLLQSSSTAATTPAARLRDLENPESLFDDFSSRNRHFVLAARLSGRTVSAFPEFADRPGHIDASLEPANVIVVGDTDLLADRMWVQSRQVAGQRVANAFADNGNFVVNAIDNLLGSEELVSLRTRAGSQRPFTVVEALRRSAEDRLRASERQLQAQLLETEQRLARLQAESGVQDIPGPEEQAEIARFEAELLRIRRELRAVRFELNADIERLGGRVKLINIVSMPLLVTLLALGFAVWRLRQRRRAADTED